MLYLLPMVVTAMLNIYYNRRNLDWADPAVLWPGFVMAVVPVLNIFEAIMLLIFISEDEL